MSAREWNPGDVAMRVDARGGTSLAVCVTDCMNHVADAHWHTVKNGRADWDTLIYSGVTYQPLVVIDPEDREQVERLHDLLMESPAGFGYTQAALREFANPTPPRPDEPLGLGAVVEDADGTKWLRHDSVAIHRRWLNTDDCDTRFRAWDEIDAVRVLSEGVTA